MLIRAALLQGPFTSISRTGWGLAASRSTYAGNPLLSFTGMPYGDGMTAVPVSTQAASDATEDHFTGKERDAESGNDYFGACCYASSMGRWMSPDWYPGPAPIPYANINDPQTLNLYIYAGNNR